MKIKIIILLIILLSAAFFLIPGKKADDQKAAHESFMGNPPEASKPYNILDYTKPAQKP